MGCHDALELPLVEVKRGFAGAVRLPIDSDSRRFPVKLAARCPGPRVRWYNPQLVEYSPEVGSRGDMLPWPGTLLWSFWCQVGRLKTNVYHVAGQIYPILCR